MASRYLLQIVDRETGTVVQCEPGGRVERAFVDDCVAKVLARGVGFGRTAASVGLIVRNSLEETIRELKAMVRS